MEIDVPYELFLGISKKKNRYRAGPVLSHFVLIEI